MSFRNTPAPLPQPTRHTCSSCCFGWDERAPVCPRCGEIQAPVARPEMDAATLVASICCVVTAGPLGAFLLFSGWTDRSSLPLNALGFFGAVFLSVALFFLGKTVRDL